MKHWRGDYVIVLPRARWKFHSCVVCGRKLDFANQSSATGVGPECARKDAEVIATAKSKALEGDRRRYRDEVVRLGFTIE